MLVTTHQKHQCGLSPLTLSLDSQPIEQVTRHHVLGAIVDKQLSWEPHTDSIPVIYIPQVTNIEQTV